MILEDLVHVKFLETKKEKARVLDSIAKRGELYSKLLHVIFDKDIRYFVDTSKINIDPEIPLHTDLELDQMFYDLLNALAKGDLRGKDGILKCENFINKVDCGQEGEELFLGILDNKPRLKIGPTDINKLCEFINIKQFEVMYALRWDKAKVDYRKRYVIQPKIDGNRMIIEKGLFENSVAYSRGGALIDSVSHIINAIDAHVSHDHSAFMIDGEVENGTLEETGSIRSKKKQCENAIYTIFGIYDYNQWKEGIHTERYESTLDVTRVFIKENFSEIKHIRLIPSYIIENVNSQEEFDKITQRYFNEFLELGYEGYVLKTLDHVYQPSSGSKRSSDWVKCKPQDTSDGTIIAIEEADGEGRGMVGNFKVQWLDVIFDVSPGKMKHHERIQIFEKSEDFIGRKIKFFHQGLSKYGVPRNSFAEGIRDVGDE